MKNNWRVLETAEGKVRELEEGDEQVCREAFRKAKLKGTTGWLTLLDPSGLEMDKFDPNPPTLKKMSFTGRPIREVQIPLPPDMQAMATAAAAELERKRQRELEKSRARHSNGVVAFVKKMLRKASGEAE